MDEQNVNAVETTEGAEAPAEETNEEADAE